MGVMPWSPLAGGFLAGKYQRDTATGKAAAGEGRLAGDNPLGQTPFTDRNWAILATLKGVAADLGRSPADVALAWTLARPGVDVVLIGASRPEQIRSNIAALDLALPADAIAALDEASAPPQTFPWSSFGASVRRSIFGGADVEAWHP